MHELIRTPQAEGDLLDIWSYIATRNPQAADEVLELIQQKCRLIAEFPNMGANRSELRPGVRSITVGNYVVFYRSTANEIEVLRVLHGARDLPSLFDA